ncbi:hypothetical protein CQW23_07099 [Capsicum baccatum]|uniref:Transposase-associated domain-containing protein n=1 Tax=Capsicum baccatum TaxID=33114 RepID=A0A2G2X589_CAPBA|nr:hypothetical protein CQW23_07099 [Capsicum baccatum]
MNNLERGWTYARLDGRGSKNSRFVTGMNNFIQYACSQQNCMSVNSARCPCKKCRNIKYKDVETVRYHILHDGFVKDYFVWKHQREIDVIGEISFGNDLINGAQLELGYDNPYRQMILDAAGPKYNHGSSWQPYNNIESGSCHPYEPLIEEEHETLVVEEPNLEYQKFNELLHSADAKLFFDSMEHLPVHLPYEAKIAGPVQYRWIYPFKRSLGTLKRMIENKESVEGSICEAYLMTESTLLFSHYFEPHVMIHNHNVVQNGDGGIVEDVGGNLSIFTHPGRL